ncbi:MAG: 5-aminolevulinate synthase [Pelagibacteraceae bacterium]|nr:5-aminolevulinate synthase [Pelagibacteraceae bacterium]
MKNHNWKFNYLSKFQNEIDKIKEEGHYRTFNSIERKVGNFPKATRHHNGEMHDIDVWCSNDYLGMSQNKEVIQSMIMAAEKLGAGSGGTRNISGTTQNHILLEEEIAKLHKKERALAFNSGYSANESALKSIISAFDNCLVLSDELNHASLIEGIRGSKKEKAIFKHNDVAHLKKVLKGVSFERPKIIVVESVYSMEADFSPLEDIVEVAQENGALIYLDEVHAVGLYGSSGGGIAEEKGIVEHIDIINGTLAKAFGLAGGYIASTETIVDYVRSFSKGFIFTTSMCPAVAAGSLESIKQVQKKHELRSEFFKNVNFVKEELRKTGIPFLDSGSHIVPVIIGDSKLCKEISDYLLNQHKVYVQPINFPTVPKGTERIRITPTPCHSREVTKNFIESLKDAWFKFMPRISSIAVKQSIQKTTI